MFCFLSKKRKRTEYYHYKRVTMNERTERENQKQLPNVDHNVNGVIMSVEGDIKQLYMEFIDCDMTYQKVKQIVDAYNSKKQCMLYCHHITKKEKNELTIDKAHIFCKCWRELKCKVEFIVDFKTTPHSVYCFGVSHIDPLNEMTYLKSSGKRVAQSERLQETNSRRV